MPSNKFYPSLRTAARTADIPELPGSFNEKIESLLKKIFYRNLTIDRSLDNSAQGIYAELMIYDALRFELFGNKGINLIFNPSYEDNTRSLSYLSLSGVFTFGAFRYYLITDMFKTMRRKRHFINTKAASLTAILK